MLTKQQASALYQLTASEQWAVFLELQQQRIDALRKDSDTISPEMLKYNQGQIEAIKKTLNLRKDVEEFLNKNK
jgi:hypothetical protein